MHRRIGSALVALGGFAVLTACLDIGDTTEPKQGATGGHAGTSVAGSGGFPNTGGAGKGGGGSGGSSASGGTAGVSASGGAAGVSASGGSAGASAGGASGGSAGSGGSGASGGSAAVCGNAVCDPGESFPSCAADETACCGLCSALQFSTIGGNGQRDCRACPATGPCCGDADGDGHLTSCDAQEIARCATGHTSACILKPELCDMNGDGCIDVTDGLSAVNAAAGNAFSNKCAQSFKNNCAGDCI